MKPQSTPDALALIDERIVALIKWPEMCAATPRALEAVFMTLDGLKESLENPEAREDIPSLYAQFLLEQGYGAATYISRHEEEEKAMDFRGLTAFLKKYIEKRDAGMRGNLATQPSD